MYTLMPLVVLVKGSNAQGFASHQFPQFSTGAWAPTQ
jgi:hypothetical protein